MNPKISPLFPQANWSGSHMNETTIAAFKQHFLLDNSKDMILCLEDFFKITAGNVLLARELLFLFKQQFHNHLEDWQKAQDAGAKIHLIHAIKGAARCIAAQKLANLSHEIENQLRSQQNPTAEENELLHAYCMELLRYISHLELRKNASHFG